MLGIEHMYVLKMSTDSFLNCSGLELRVRTKKNNFLISQPKHVVGTQKNRHIEMVLLST